MNAERGEDDLEEKVRRVMFTVDWNGPWERLEGFANGIRRDGSLRWEIPADPRGWRAALGWLADWCNRRDLAWRRRFLASGDDPWSVWKRRG